MGLPHRRVSLLGRRAHTRTRFDDIGSRIVGRGSLFFDAVAVPASQMLGDEHKGFSQVMQGFDFSRAPLAQCQGVSFPLAEGESTSGRTRRRTSSGCAT